MKLKHSRASALTLPALQFVSYCKFCVSILEKENVFLRFRGKKNREFGFQTFRSFLVQYLKVTKMEVI